MGEAIGGRAGLDLGHHLAGLCDLSGLPKRAGELHPRRNEPIHPRDHRAEMGDRTLLCAQQDLRMADLARAECRSILAELETAWLCEEKDMVSRAGWLSRESDTVFEKMSPNALSKLQLDVVDEEGHPNPAMIISSSL